MWRITTDRRGFLEYLTSANAMGVVREGRTVSAGAVGQSGQELELLWPDEPTQERTLPSILVVGARGTQDFLAWANTYLPGYRPLTGFCRVLTGPQFAALSCPRSDFPIGPLAEPVAALIIAEALTHGRGRVTIRTLSLAACHSTYSFVRARGLAAGTVSDWDRLGRDWERARAVARQPERVPTYRDVEMIWRLLVGPERPLGDAQSTRDQGAEGSLEEAVRELRNEGTVSPRSRLFANLGQDVAASLDAMTKNREERVLAFERLLRRIADTPRDRAGAFFAGYVASLMSPGSLEYADLMSSHLGSAPDLLLWYGLCAGLAASRNRQAQRLLGDHNALGRRLVRDVSFEEPVWSPPRADISIDELEVVARAGEVPQQVHLTQSGTARVELAPGVTTSVRLTAPDGPRPGLFDEPSRQETLTPWIQQLGTALRQLNSVFESRGVPAPGDDAGGPQRKRHPRRRRE